MRYSFKGNYFELFWKVESIPGDFGHTFGRSPIRDKQSVTLMFTLIVRAI